MINIETGRGGRVYQIWQQQQQSSCGVASAWMARGIARQMSFAEEEFELARRIYLGAVNTSLGAAASAPAAPMTFDPNSHGSNQNSMGATFANFGLFYGQLATALRNEGLKVEVQHNNGGQIAVVANKIAYNKPAISFVKWNGPGAHFVVVGRCVPSHVTFLDPWTGHINEQPNDGRYRATYNTGRVLVNLYISV
ncbi:MAG: hypothetical protein NTW74_08820 [Acidobacteria bacterium]|nr:hypothetical protein [Acidobacteriota bacterium]